MRSDPKGSPAKPGHTRPFGVKPCAAKVVYAGELKAAMRSITPRSGTRHPEVGDVDVVGYVGGCICRG